MFPNHKYSSQLQRLCQPGVRVLVLAIVLMAFGVFSFQSFTINPRNSLAPLFPESGETSSSGNSSSEELGEATLSNGSRTHGVQKRGIPVAGESDDHLSETDETDGDPDDLDLDGEESQDDELSIDLGNGVRMRKVKDQYGGYITLQTAGNSSSVDMDEERSNGYNSTSIKEGQRSSSLELGWEKEGNLHKTPPSSPSFVSHPESSSIGTSTPVKQGSKSSDSVANVAPNFSSSGKNETEANQTIARSGEKRPPQSGVADPDCGIAEDHARKKKRKRTAVTIAEMDRSLQKNRVSLCSKRPQWSSKRDRQILEAKRQILNAPMVENDLELYSPAFRNLSRFKRSYELMEKMLKVYVYREGENPIFHQPPLTGIYASEGWFMKHMEASKHFLVDDPTKAHLFYIPFSSSRLRSKLYVPGSPHHRNLIDYMKTYVGTIAAKYPFWNRTNGADHFVASCHDWAPVVTANAMGNSIRALCNADVTQGFELGKDVSLPETNVRKDKDPLRDVGGRPAENRPVLAFFAGQMHGYLRPVLLQHWENRDPDIKVFGPLPRTSRRRKGSAYVQYMKSSKYCICPRGYEVNSPRVVESIFYECVPVIISDNFVPPFFEVFDWEAFSVVVAERDVPRLKEMLLSIPRKKYLALQAGVRRVQRHFLWHRQPVKYDLFHMILHSVWFNRVFNLQPE